METKAILNSSKPIYLAEVNSPFSSVPNEVLEIIFNFLPRPLDLLFASRVCKRWKTVCLSKVLPARLDSLFLHKLLLNKANPQSPNITNPLSPQVYFSHFRPFSANAAENRALKKLYSLTWSNRKISCFDFSSDHLAISYKVNNHTDYLFYADYRKPKSVEFRVANAITEIFLDASTQDVFFVEKYQGLKVMEADFKIYDLNESSALKIKSKFNRCYFLKNTMYNIYFIDNKTNKMGVAIPSVEDELGPFAQIKDFCLSRDNKIFVSYETSLSTFSNGRVRFVHRDSFNLYGWDIETSKAVTSFPTQHSHLISSDENLLASYEFSSFEVFDTKSSKKAFNFKVEKKYETGATQLILEDSCLYSLTNGHFQVRDLRKPDTAFEPLGDKIITRFAHHNDIFLFLTDEGNLDFCSFRQKDNLDKLKGLAQGFANFFKSKK